MEAPTGSNIRLRWTSHQGTVLSVFDSFLSAQSLVDVTLACEGHQLRAHKLVLSACSPYFQELFGSNTGQHTILYLKGVKFSELEALIEFMYRGEANIPQETLPSLLALAQDLRIRGLVDEDTMTSTNLVGSKTILIPELNKTTIPVSSNNPVTLSSVTSSNTNMSQTPTTVPRVSSGSLTQVTNVSLPTNGKTAAYIPTTNKTNQPPSKRQRMDHIQSERSHLAPETIPTSTAYGNVLESSEEFTDPLEIPTDTVPMYSAQGHTPTLLNQSPYDRADVIPYHTEDDEEVKIEMEEEDVEIMTGIDEELEDGENSIKQQSGYGEVWSVEGDNSGCSSDVPTPIPGTSRTRSRAIKTQSQLGDQDHQQQRSGDGEDFEDMVVNLSTTTKNQSRQVKGKHYTRLEKYEMSSDDEDQTDFELPIFPLATSKELKILSSQILTNSLLKQELISKFKLVGGNSIRDCVDLIMNFLVEDSVGCKYSLLGGNLNNNFSDLVYKDLILTALVENTTVKVAVTKPLISKALLFYFRNVKRREKMRKERNERYTILIP